MAGETVLVIDDTPVNLKLTRILLASAGFKVVTAASAEEALEILQGSRPHLILADIQLPGMDGLELTRILKGDEKTRDIAVIALSAFATAHDEQKAVEAGCDGYITKPIDTRTLVDRLRVFLDSRAPEPAASPDGAAPGHPVPDGDMRTLRLRFLTDGLERSRRLLDGLDGLFNADEAAREVHQWVGAAGLLGYSSIAQLARALQEDLAERPLDNAQLRESFDRLVRAFSEPDGSGV